MILRTLHLATGLHPDYIQKLARTASHRYKRYEIDKRDGSKREIFHPARELKLLQNCLAQKIFSQLPVHELAMAYRLGKGIKANALLHVRQNYLLRVDFKDFFPSISATDIEALLSKSKITVNFNSEDISLIRSICFRHGSLTIGAPCSPVISNVVMFELDKVWSGFCERLGVTYSRYADDLYFSTNQRDILASVLLEIRNTLRECTSPRLYINEAKTIYTSRKKRRLVTGLVLTSDRKISLGRANKRKMKSLVFKFLRTKLSAEELNYLRGYLSYITSVEPSFITTLRAKYGENAVSQILQKSS